MSRPAGDTDLNKNELSSPADNEGRAAELIIANNELAYHNEEKEKKAAELIVANKELANQNKEKEQRAAELLIANEELIFQNSEKEKRAAELIVANKELAYQNKEKEQRAAELLIANEELIFQNSEKEKRAAELIVANKELAYQNKEKEQRAAELLIANEELIFQNSEKEKRAAELLVANIELAYQNEEKAKRAAELIITHEALAIQHSERVAAYEDRNTILERIDDGFFAVNENSIVTYWNTRAEILLSLKREDAIGKNLHDIFAATASEIFYNNYQKALEENTTIHFEGFSARTNKWFEVSAYGADNGLSVYFKDVTGSKISENLLIESEVRYRSINEQATDAICITDASMKFTNINPYGCEVFGYTLEEALQLSLPDILFKDDLATNPLRVAELKLGKTIRNERRLRRKNGTAINMEVSTKIMEDGRLIMFGHDITERKKTELLISESEKKYRQIVETAQEGIWLTDQDHVTTFVNQKMADIFEYSPEEMIGKSNYYFMDEEWKKKAMDRIENREPRLSEIFDFKYVTKSGREVWMNLSTNPLFDEMGLYNGALAMVTDITERKKAGQEMIEVFEEKNTILESIDDAFFAVDRNWVVTYWNNQAEKVLGKPKNEILGHNLWSVFSDSVNSESYLQYHQAVETGQSAHFEDFYPSLQKWYEISAYPSGNGLSVYFKDVSERKLSEIRLNELNESLQVQTRELAVSNTELEQFAYVASHDLQEPLRMVISFLNQLEKKYGSAIDERGKKYIDFAVNGARRMRQIILDLLDFSRVGKAEEKHENLDLNEVVAEIQMLFRKKMEDRNATITVDALPTIHAHRSPVHQVFQNLIGNALKYSKSDSPAQIHIGVTETGNCWQFSITDNGIGIAEEYYDKIFIIFQRLHNKDEYSGTGMGLAVTKKIIETQGGKIWVRSEVGKGSTFYFTMKK